MTFILNELFDIYLLYDITNHIHEKDLIKLSKCDRSMFKIVHSATFIKRTVYSLDEHIETALSHKNWGFIFRCAVNKRYIELCKYLVKSKRLTINNALQHTAICGNLNTFRQILSLEKRKYVNLSYSLNISAKYGHLKLCKYIVSLGVPKYSIENALFKAAENGYKEICEYFVSLDVLNTDNSDHINRALHHAATYDLEICKYFISLGATNFDYALCGAAEIGYEDICEYFVSLGAKKYSAALYHAKKNEHEELCEYFISLDITNFDYGLYEAADDGNVELCEYFISLGATDLNNSLFTASINGHIDVCNYMIQKGASNINDALNCANVNGHIELYKSLLNWKIEDKYRKSN